MIVQRIVIILACSENINFKKIMSQIYADNWCLNEKSSSRETFYIYFKYFFLIIRINELLLPSLYTPLSSAVCKVCSRAGVIRCSDVIFRLSPFIDKPSISEAMLNSPRRKEVGLLRPEIRFLWIWQFESSREICNGWKSLNVS